MDTTISGDNSLGSDSNGRKRDNTAISSGEEVFSDSSGPDNPDNPFKAPRRINDDRPPPDDNEPKWRKDPSETYSDWKIEIKTVDQPEEVKTYHVHKFILAVGRRKSDYFARLFQMQSKFREGDSCTSHIELEPLAAQAFPQLLDYVYDYEKPLNITIETAAALHHLGEYFEMQNLRYDAKEYCKKKFTVDNVHVVYQHAMQFQDSSFLSMVAEFLGEHMLEIEHKTCRIMNEPDPELWLNALKHVDRQDKEAVAWSSKVIARFCDNHRDRLDMRTFRKLTDKSVLPIIHCNAALTLCKHDDRFLNVLEKASPPPPEQEGVVWVDEITDLQSRCASSLAALQTDQWDNFLSSEHKIDKLRIRKTCFVVDLLVKVLRTTSAREKRYEKTVNELRTVLKNFRPISRNGRIIQRHPLHRNEHIEVPAELQWARPDLGEAVSFGFQESLFPNSEQTLYPAFIYDPLAPAEDSDSEGENAGPAVLQQIVARMQEAMPAENGEENHREGAGAGRAHAVAGV